MKNILLCAVSFLFALGQTNAQDTTAQKQGGSSPTNGGIIKTKTKNEVLPHFFIDLNGFYGIGETFTPNLDLYKNAYKKTEVDPTNNFHGNLSYIRGNSWGASFECGRFFGDKKHIGISIGALYAEQFGTLAIDSFHIQYRSIDSHHDSVRQVITSDRKIEEKISLTEINIPVLLHYRHQFNNSNFGVFASGGVLLGIVSGNHYNTNASFSYESIYNLKSGTVDHNPINGLDPTDLLYTKSYNSALYNENPAIISTRFDSLYTRGYNVGLAKGVNDKSKSISQKYNSVSFGFMLRAGFSYQISYRLTANLGGYISQQTFKNNDDASYRLTDKVGNYGSIIKGSTSTVNTTYGVMLGVRFFLGPDKDLDGDGVPDRKDDCPRQRGYKGDFHGCPDTDGDGILDKDDACPLQRGPLCTGGCPDKDGDCVPDLKDRCEDEFGLASLQGCPVEREKRLQTSATIVHDTIFQNVGTETPYVVLSTTVVYFDLGKASMSEDTYAGLNEAIAALQKDKNLFLLVSGYTDDIGGESSNLVLSVKRAESVKKYFVEKGVEDRRVLLSGYGKKYPAIEGKTAEARRANRRIEIKILLPVTKTKQ